MATSPTEVHDLANVLRKDLSYLFCRLFLSSRILFPQYPRTTDFLLPSWPATQTPPPPADLSKWCIGKTKLVFWPPLLSTFYTRPMLPFSFSQLFSPFPSKVPLLRKILVLSSHCNCQCSWEKKTASRHQFILEELFALWNIIYPILIIVTAF